MLTKTLKSLTKTIDINAPATAVFNFFVNPLNWPQYAVVNLKSVKKSTGGWYDMTTLQGKGKLKMNADPSKGILDHTWQDPQATWTVPARVVSNGEGATFMITFFQPPPMPDEVFNEAMKGMDIELTKLKEILEK